MMTEFWRGRRVFVTGHTGFKGAWLCLLLRRMGAHVAGYALDPPTRPALFELARVGDLVQSTIADVRDLDRLARSIGDFGPDCVIHMAAQSVVLDSYADPVGTYSVNVMGTVNVLEAVRRLARSVVVINVTTDKCYRNRGWVWGYRENDRLGGRDPYSNSKACAELVAEAYRQSYFPIDEIDRHGVSIACARAGNVIGGGDWTPHQLVPAAVAAFREGKPVVLRNPKATRPWQYVLDCLGGYLRLAAAATGSPKQYSEEWNFGPSVDDVITVAEVAEALAKHWNVVPAWEPSRDRHPREETMLMLDCAKAGKELGWRCRLTPRAAIDWVAEWYLRTQSGEAARDVSNAQIDAYLDSIGELTGPDTSDSASPLGS